MNIHTIQLNIADFESGTAGMDAKEKGAYISLLICLYKVSTHELPDDDKRLARMACLNLREWKKIRPILEPKFIVNGGVWTQKRVIQDVLRYTKLSNKNRSNALKTNETGEPVACQSHSQKGANISNKEQVISKKERKNPPNPPEGKEVLPEFISPDVWKDFCKYRGKNFTNLAKKKMFNQLTEWNQQGYNADEILNTTIVNGWKGIFKPKGKSNETNIRNKDKSTRADEAMQRALESFA